MREGGGVVGSRAGMKKTCNAHRTKGLLPPSRLVPPTLPCTRPVSFASHQKMLSRYLVSRYRAIARIIILMRKKRHRAFFAVHHQHAILFSLHSLHFLSPYSYQSRLFAFSIFHATTPHTNKSPAALTGLVTFVFKSF